MTRSADDRRAVTGKRRLAFAAYADEERLPHLLVLLRSLALTNPRVCEDFVLLHPGLPEAALEAAGRLHPRLVARRAETPRRAELFRIDDYDTVVALEPGMVVLGDIGELLRLRDGVGAVPQLLPGDLTKERRTVLDDGLLVIQRTALTDGLLARLGTGSGVDGALEDALVRLDARYDFLAHRLFDDAPVPDNVAILRFTGATGRPGYAPAEEARRRFEMTDDEFREAYCALPGGKHPDLLVHCAVPLLRRRPRVDLARAVAEVHRQQGRYTEAVEVLAPLVASDADRPRCHQTLGVSLMALSRYDEAETHLLLATAAPDIASKVFTQLARLAWLRGADDAAHAYARQGLDADPTDGPCRAWYERTRPAVRNRERAAAGPAEEQFAHVALFADGQENAGDKVLPEAVRMCLDTDTGPGRWLSIHAHRLFDDAALEQVNARRGLIIGGGGLFLPDTAPNANSTWQWNVPNETLARITVPLAVFAVGYNVFDGQVYRRQRFAESLRALVAQSAFFGLRNRGSVARVRELLPEDLRHRVLYQPCPTTVTRQLVPDWTDPAERDDTVLINCAYDRAGLRFGHDYGHFLAQMASAVRALGDRAEVRYAAHMPTDETFVHDLRREHGIALPVEPLYDLDNDAVRDLYRRTKLVIGMRGHAGMIPFGCGTPIISLVSHPKLAYFLADIERPEWGVSVHDRDLGAVLTERAGALLGDHAAAVADVHDRQENLWRITQENMTALRAIFA
ncbi:polysaccharide pyruvyl transferase family protein [Streptomyces litchfieldiae]|uniref:Polysaccharide pyruvyl transferase family protein n=1 Tax=Streptomyces litchfieldiae TaxID=3075543 RepID=A0ABU2MPJ3_9ACTN|nr:polysaccharide pyruvyl transferase family protein [Streptomyces sp. DSM 44938]MDT0343519.1 polysaccharide pyruvyl transferase family protein [Streptomyces sp. DSM 44938]